MSLRLCQSKEADARCEIMLLHALMIRAGGLTDPAIDPDGSAPCAEGFEAQPNPRAVACDGISWSKTVFDRGGSIRGRCE